MGLPLGPCGFGKNCLFVPRLLRDPSDDCHPSIVLIVQRDGGQLWLLQMGSDSSTGQGGVQGSLQKSGRATIYHQTGADFIVFAATDQNGCPDGISSAEIYANRWLGHLSQVTEDSEVTCWPLTMSSCLARLERGSCPEPLRCCHPLESTRPASRRGRCRIHSQALFLRSGLFNQSALSQRFPKRFKLRRLLLRDPLKVNAKAAVAPPQSITLYAEGASLIKLSRAYFNNESLGRQTLPGH